MTATIRTVVPEVTPCPEWCTRSGKSHRWQTRSNSPGMVEGVRTHLRSLGTVGEYRVRLDHFECFELREGEWTHLNLGEPHVCIGEWDNLTPSQARKLAALLIQAADTIDPA